MTQDELRKRAEYLLARHCMGYLPGRKDYIDAMLAFAAERVAAESDRCANIDPGPLNIGANACPHEVWTKYKEAIEKGASDALD